MMSASLFNWLNTLYTEFLDPLADESQKGPKLGHAARVGHFNRTSVWLIISRVKFMKTWQRDPDRKSWALRQNVEFKGNSSLQNNEMGPRSSSKHSGNLHLLAVWASCRSTGELQPGGSWSSGVVMLTVTNRSQLFQVLFQLFRGQWRKRCCQL
jgi:hypothetical protein